MLPFFADYLDFQPLPTPPPAWYEPYLNAGLTAFAAALIFGIAYTFWLTYPRWSKHLISGVKKLSFFSITKIVLIVLLVSCVDLRAEEIEVPHNLIRWIACPIFTVLAWQAYERKKFPWAWCFGVTAGIFNPIFQAKLYALWHQVDIIAVGLVVASFYVLKTKIDQ